MLWGPDSFSPPLGDVGLIEGTEHPQKALRYSHRAQEDNLNLFPVTLWLIASKCYFLRGRHLALGLGGARRGE